MKFGVLLSGCGFADGSEVHEAVFCLHSLEVSGITPVCLSLDRAQTKTVDHNSGKESSQSRNVLEESARIARGEIQSLLGLDLSSLDGLLIPGGFGAALNLCNFALAADKMKVEPEVESLVREIHKAGKPLGAVCIAPVLLAKVLGKFNPTLTVGDSKEVEECLSSFGAKMKKCSEGSCIVDSKNKIVTTPAYMIEQTSMTQVALGIQKMVENLLRFSS